MKNQYVGDIGDYGKLGMLRQVKDFKLGVNWYYTPNDKKSDGGYKKYDMVCDSELYATLQDLIKSKNINLEALQNSGVLPNSKFYNEMLDFDSTGKSKTAENMKEYRKQWHKSALDKLKGCDIVFLDPDNGLITDAKKPHTKEGHKFVTYDEVKDYFNAGATVIIYNHRDRVDIDCYKQRLKKVKKILPESELKCIYMNKKVQRDFLFVIQPKHSVAINKCIESIVNGDWKGFFMDRELSK